MTKPDYLKTVSDPVGPENDKWLLELRKNAKLIVAGWGGGGAYQGRDQMVMSLLPKLHCLGLTNGGHPRHPLYAKSECTPVPFTSEPVKKLKSSGCSGRICGDKDCPCSECHGEPGGWLECDLTDLENDEIVCSKCGRTGISDAGFIVDDFTNEEALEDILQDYLI